MAPKGIGVTPWAPKPKKDAPTAQDSAARQAAEKAHDDTEYEPLAVPFDGVKGGFNVWLQGGDEATVKQLTQQAVDIVVGVVQAYFVRRGADELAAMYSIHLSSKLPGWVVFQHSDGKQHFSVPSLDKLAQSFRDRSRLLHDLGKKAHIEGYVK